DRGAVQHRRHVSRLGALGRRALRPLPPLTEEGAVRLLLMSNSRMEGLGYLEHARPAIADALGATGKRVLFISWATVVRSPDDYLDLVRPVFAEVGCTVDGIHRSADPGATVAAAEAIVVGGGNTWHLVRQLHLHGVMDVIRKAVRGGTPYLGWSAGANIACPT